MSNDGETTEVFLVFPTDYLHSMLPPPIAGVVYAEKLDLGTLLELGLNVFTRSGQTKFLAMEDFEKYICYDTLTDYVTDVLLDKAMADGTSDGTVIPDIDTYPLEQICIACAWEFYMLLYDLIKRTIQINCVKFGGLSYVNYTDTAPGGSQTDPTVILGFESSFPW